MAHVYAADQGLQLQNETVEAIMYDDAAMLLLVIKGGVVFAYDLALDVPTQHEQLVWTYPLQDGPPVLRARCSLDRQLLALQRSPLLLELVDLLSGNISVMASDKGRNELLGMFFSELPDAQLVLVSRAGLEMCTFAARRQGLHSRERLRLPVHWYLYSHETRCCLVATGPPLGPPYMQAWQFLASGMVTLPPFTLATSFTGTALNSQPPSTQGLSGDSALQQPNTGSNQAVGVPAAGSLQGSLPPRDPFPSLPISTHASGGEDAPSSGSRTASGTNSTVGSTAMSGPRRHSTSSQQSVAAGGAGKSQGSEAAAWKVVKQPVSSLLSWMGGGGSTAVSDALGGAGIVQSVLPSWSTPTTGPMTPSDVVPPSTSVRLVKMYGRVYCVHVLPAARRLDLYRLFTDTVALQHSYELPAAVFPAPSPFLAGSSTSTSSPAANATLTLSVVDNVLVLHVPHVGATLLFDVCADTAKPISEQHPLGHLAPLRRPRQLHEERLQLQLARQMRAAVASGNALGGSGLSGLSRAMAAGSGLAAVPVQGGGSGPQLPQPTAWSVMDDGGAFSSGSDRAGGGMQLDPAHTHFHLPNLIVDSSAQVVYRLLLDLHAITHSSTVQATLAAFLQRRRAPRLHVQPVELTLGLGLPGFALPPSPLPSASLRATSNPASLATSPELGSRGLLEREVSQGQTLESPRAVAGGGPAPASQNAAGRNTQLGVANTGGPPEWVSGANSSGGAVAWESGGGGSTGSDLGASMGLRPSMGSGLGSGSPMLSAPHPVMLSGVVSVGAITCKLLLLQHVQGLLQSELPLAELRAVFDAMSKAFSEVALAAAAGRASSLAASACVVSPSDLTTYILAAMCTAADLTAPRWQYLQGVLAELSASVAAAGVRPPAGLQLLGLQMICAPTLLPPPSLTPPPAASPTVTLSPHAPPSQSARATPAGATAGAWPGGWLQAAAEGAQRELVAASSPSVQSEALSVVLQPEQVQQQGEMLARVLHCSWELLSPEITPSQVKALGQPASIGTLPAGGSAAGAAAAGGASVPWAGSASQPSGSMRMAGMTVTAADGVDSAAPAGQQSSLLVAAAAGVGAAAAAEASTALQVIRARMTVATQQQAQGAGAHAGRISPGRSFPAAAASSGSVTHTAGGSMRAGDQAESAQAPASASAAPTTGVTGPSGVPAGSMQSGVASNASLAVAGADAWSSNSSSKEPGVVLVMELLAQGRIVKAARVARELHVWQLPPAELLRAASHMASNSAGAAASGASDAQFAALYRCFRPGLMPLYPTLSAARQALLSL